MAWRSASARPSRRSTQTARCCPTASAWRRTRSSGRRASARTRCSRSSACPLDDQGRVRVDRLPPCRGQRRRVGARRLRSRAERGHAGHCGSADIASTRCARRDARSQPRDSPRPYRYRMLGQVATLGRYRGIADIFGLRLRGFPGWFVTRTYSPEPAAAVLTQAPCRVGLDRRALLPARHRRARHSRPSTTARRAVAGAR